jgi:hypothetical protein
LEFEPTPRVMVRSGTAPTPSPVTIIGIRRLHAIHRFQFTLRGFLLAIAFFAIDFSVVAPLCRSTEPSRLVNWGVAIVVTGYLFAAFLTIAGAESGESELR